MFHAVVAVITLAKAVAGLGSTCSSPLGPGNAAPNDPFWLGQIKHQGKSAFNTDQSYQVFRNVKVQAYVVCTKLIIPDMCLLLSGLWCFR